MSEKRERQEPGSVQARQEGREALTPWLGWMLGPAAWAMHQCAGYVMVPWICNVGRSWPYHALSWFAVLLCGLGFLTARNTLLRARRVRPTRSAQRLRMMALGGFMLCAAAVFGIAVEYAGSFWLDFCAGIIT